MAPLNLPQQGGSMDENAEAPIVDTEEQAAELFASGKRHYVCHDYQKAVDDFSECCRIYNAIFGELHCNLAEPYLYYGKSLIELERINQQVVNVAEKQNGDAQDEETSSDEDEDEEEGEELESANELDDEAKNDNQDGNAVKIDDKTTTKFEAGESTDKIEIQALSEPVISEPSEPVEPVKDIEKPEEPTVVEISETVTPAECPENGSVPSYKVIEPDEQPCSSNGATATNLQNGGEPDENSGISTAWEILDLARIIFERQLNELEKEEDQSGNEKSRMHTLERLAEVRMTLGEVCALDDKFQEAITEFREAQMLLRTCCPPDDRRLAETFFQIALACELTKDFQTAAENIKCASKVLQSRKANLEAKLLVNVTSEKSSESSEDKTTTGVDDKEQATEKVRAEIDDLDQILADIDQRLVDLMESQATTGEVQQELSEYTKSPSKENVVKGEPAEVSGSLKASDVSHLVRKPLKRATADEQEKSPDGKRVRLLSEKMAESEISDVTDNNGENGCEKITTAEVDPAAEN